MIQIFSAGRDGTGPIEGSTRGPRGPKKTQVIDILTNPEFFLEIFSINCDYVGKPINPD